MIILWKVALYLFNVIIISLLFYYNYYYRYCYKFNKYLTKNLTNVFLILVVEEAEVLEATNEGIEINTPEDIPVHLDLTVTVDKVPCVTQRRRLFLKRLHVHVHYTI